MKFSVGFLLAFAVTSQQEDDTSLLQHRQKNEVALFANILLEQLDQVDRDSAKTFIDGWTKRLEMAATVPLTTKEALQRRAGVGYHMDGVLDKFDALPSQTRQALIKVAASNQKLNSLLESLPETEKQALFLQVDLHEMEKGASRKTEMNTTLDSLPKTGPKTTVERTAECKVTNTTNGVYMHVYKQCKDGVETIHQGKTGHTFHHQHKHNGIGGNSKTVTESGSGDWQHKHSHSHDFNATTGVTNTKTETMSKGDGIVDMTHTHQHQHTQVAGVGSVSITKTVTDSALGTHSHAHIVKCQENPLDCDSQAISNADGPKLSAIFGETTKAPTTTVKPTTVKP